MKKKIPTVIRIIIQILLIGGGAYYFYRFAALAFIRIINIANILGVIMSLSAILIGVYMKKIIKFCKKHYKSKKGKILLNSFFTVFAVGILCFSLALGSVITSANTNADEQDTIIVLGCAVYSYTLKCRVNAAYEYLEKNPDSVAVLSGGQGNNEPISEAQAMFNMLTEKGIEPERLYLEDTSVNTDTNIKNSIKIIEENNLDKDVAVVSSDYHLKRATMICEKNGLKNPHRISAPSTYNDKPTFYLREVMGVVKEVLAK